MPPHAPALPHRRRIDIASAIISLYLKCVRTPRRIRTNAHRADPIRQDLHREADGLVKIKSLAVYRRILDSIVAILIFIMLVTLVGAVVGLIFDIMGGI